VALTPWLTVAVGVGSELAEGKGDRGGQAGAGAVALRFPLSDGAYRGKDSDFFGELPRFIDSLVSLSQDLILVPRDKRTGILRNRLGDVGRRFLPCNVLYMPLGNACHRIWKIHAVESSAFSTKERVPCLVCFEVIDYYTPKKGPAKKKWWNIDNLKMPALSHTFKSVPLPGPFTCPPLPDSNPDVP
jgi:hypothetical protein